MRYHNDDRLYVPVENIDLLSRYGGAETEVQLDRLGGANWQARKAKLKKNILELAGQLINVAAARQLRQAEAVSATGRSGGEAAGFKSRRMSSVSSPISSGLGTKRSTPARDS